MRLIKAAMLIALCLSVVLFYACGKDDDDDVKDWGGDGLCDACLENAPDPDSLKIDIPGADDTNKALGDLAEYYDDTVDISRALNGWILFHLGWLDEILSFPPTDHDGQYCIWGPFIPDGLSPVEVQFKMRRVTTDTFDYYWQERPKETQDDWDDVWYGDIVPSSSTARRGLGSLAIDYTLAQALDPTIDISGLMQVDYDTFSDGRQIDITFTDFTSNYFQIPTDAQYHYHNFADNSGEFSYLFMADFSDGSGGTILAQYNYNTQWQSDGTGASRLNITGLSSVPWPGTSANIDHFEGYECWGSDFKRTYWEQKLYLDDSSVIDLEGPEGNIADCAF